MLYPSDTDSTQDFLEKKFELDRRKDLFKAAEDAIVNLGTRLPNFFFLWIFSFRNV